MPNFAYEDVDRAEREREANSSRREWDEKVAKVVDLRDYLGEVLEILEDETDPEGVLAVASELPKVAEKLRVLSEEMTVLREELRSLIT